MRSCSPWGPEAAPLSSLQTCGGEGAELSHLMMAQRYTSLIYYPITLYIFSFSGPLLVPEAGN